MKETEPEKKAEMLEADWREAGRKPAGAPKSGSNFPGQEVANIPSQPALIEKTLERGNMLRTLGHPT
jgi:hypothetical protein